MLWIRIIIIFQLGNIECIHLHTIFFSFAGSTVYLGPALLLVSLSTFFCPEPNLMLHFHLPVSYLFLQCLSVSFLVFQVDFFLFTFSPRTYFNVSQSTLHTCPSPPSRLGNFLINRSILGFIMCYTYINIYTYTIRQIILTTWVTN